MQQKSTLLLFLFETGLRKHDRSVNISLEQSGCSSFKSILPKNFSPSLQKVFPP